jgi:hypothetical protein
MRRSVKPSIHRRYFLAAPACRVETVVPVRIQQDLRFGRDSVPVSHSSTDENQSEGKSGRGAEQPQALNTMRRRRKYNLMVLSIRGKSPASHKQPSGHAPQPSSLGASLLLFSSPSLCRKAKPGFCYTMLPVACCLHFGLILNENRASRAQLPAENRLFRQGPKCRQGQMQALSASQGQVPRLHRSKHFYYFSLPLSCLEARKTAQDFPRYAQDPASTLVKRVSHQFASLKTAQTSI